MGNLFSSSRSPQAANPSVAEIEARHKAEKARADAEQAARDARALAEQIKQEAEEERERARERHEEAERARAFAAEETERMKARLEEAKEAARHAQELAVAAANAAKEEAAKLAEQAREEKGRAERIRQDAEKKAAAAREEAERVQRAAEEERRQAEASKTLAEEAVRAAAEATKQALAAKEEAEMKLKQGIQPIVTPSPEELAAAKRRVQYKEDHFHFAIAGISGSGKSSLVNAFRGLKSKEAGAAAVGVTETTLQMTRYPEPNPENRFAWYDIPGAGTLKCRDWQYFNDQGLYVFDCILVLFDNRFTMTDVAILVNCRRFNIPTYIVRSKADQHIRNLMMDMGYESEGSDEEGVERKNRLHKAARKQFIEQTQKSVKANLEDANLPNQRVYIVSNSTLLGIVQSKMPKKTIDEMELLTDLYNEAHARRSANARNGSQANAVLG